MPGKSASLFSLGGSPAAGGVFDGLWTPARGRAAGAPLYEDSAALGEEGAQPVLDGVADALGELGDPLVVRTTVGRWWCDRRAKVHRPLARKWYAAGDA